jgi:hypothetical protein
MTTGSWFVKGTCFIEWKARGGRIIWASGPRELQDMRYEAMPSTDWQYSGVRQDYPVVSTFRCHENI